MAKSKNLVRDELEKSQIENRQNLKKKQQDLKEDQIFKFDIKKKVRTAYEWSTKIWEVILAVLVSTKKELEWLLQMYTEQDEIDRVKEQINELGIERDGWLRKYEMDIEDEERDMDRREEEEEIRLSSKHEFFLSGKGWQSSSTQTPF